MKATHFTTILSLSLVTCGSYLNANIWIASLKLKAYKQYENFVEKEAIREDVTESISMDYYMKHKSTIQNAFKIINDDLNYYDTMDQNKLNYNLCKGFYIYHNEVRKRCKKGYNNPEDIQINKILTIAEKLFAYKNYFNIVEFEKIVVFDILVYILLRYNILYERNVHFIKSMYAFAWFRVYRTRNTGYKLTKLSNFSLVNPNNYL
ncbi:hypothetical protein COBT_000902, partial [Conglomerata obtusa]